MEVHPLRGKSMTHVMILAVAGCSGAHHSAIKRGWSRNSGEVKNLLFSVHHLIRSFIRPFCSSLPFLSYCPLSLLRSSLSFPFSSLPLSTRLFLCYSIPILICPSALPLFCFSAPLFLSSVPLLLPYALPFSLCCSFSSKSFSFHLLLSSSPALPSIIPPFLSSFPLLLFSFPLFLSSFPLSLSFLPLPFSLYPLLLSSFSLLL